MAPRRRLRTPHLRRHGRHALRRLARRRRRRRDREPARDRGHPAADAERQRSTRSAPAAAASPTSRRAACASGPERAGADPRPGLLRPRRHAADRDRREPRCSGGSGRRRLPAAAMRSTATPPRRPSSRSQPSSGSARSSSPRGSSRVANAKMADAIRDAHGRAAASTRATSPSSPSAAPARCTPSSSPRSSRSREVVVPAGPGRSRPGGCCRRRSATTSCAPSSATLETVDPDDLAGRRPRASRGGRGRARATRASTRARVRCDATVDLRYVGQEYTLNVPVRLGPTAATSAELARPLHGRPPGALRPLEPGEPVEIVNRAHDRARRRPAASGSPLPADTGRRSADAVARPSSTDRRSRPALYVRAALGAGSDVTGPCIVLEERLHDARPARLARRDDDRKATCCSEGACRMSPLIRSPSR